ncbi:hypothetical protein Tco_0607348, partial [Tanacetum coccineum]
MYEGLLKRLDAYTQDIMDLLRLDDAVAETLGMTDLQPDASQLMDPVHHKQDKVTTGGPSFSVEDYDNPDSADVVPENA